MKKIILGLSLIVSSSFGVMITNYDNVSPITASLTEGTHVNIDSNQSSAFGEVLTVEPTPILQYLFTYGLNSEVWTTTTTNSAGGTVITSSLLKIFTGATANSESKVESKIAIKYNAGQGSKARFTAMWENQGVGSKTDIGLGDTSNGFFVAVSNNIFGVLRRDASNNYFTPQTSFTEDQLDGSGASGMVLDTTKLNVFEIKMQYLGAGEVAYGIENPATGKFFYFHKEKYANSHTRLTIEQPSLPLHIHVTNTTGTKNASLYTGSVGGFSEGKNAEIGLTFATAKQKTITTESPVLNLKVLPTYNGISNKIRIKVTSIGFATDGSKTVDFKIYKNVILGGSPVFVNVSTANSIVAIDTAGTLTSGTLCAAMALGKIAQDHLNQSDIELYVQPGEILTITATSGGGSDVDVTLIWKELF